MAVDILARAMASGKGSGSSALGIKVDHDTDEISLTKRGELIADSGAILPKYGLDYDTATGGLTLTKDGEGVQGETVALPPYGSPLKADAIADMTDTDKVYVLATDGHWYYYNGSTWTDGGVYNAVEVVTDKTLTVADTPADAKATGDEIYDIKTQLGETVSVKYENEISCSINVSTGTLTNNSKSTTVWLRCLPNKIYIVRKNAGGRFAVGDTTDIPASGVICNDKITNNTASEIVYKTSSEAKYLVAFVYFSDTDGDKNTMLSSVDIRYYSAYDIVARNQIDAMYGRLIDVFRNTAFINTSGESVLKRFADEIGVKGWLDVIGSYTINSDTGNIAPTDQNYRAVSSWFDVGSGTAITSEFTDWQNPEMKYAIYCYDSSKTYIERGNPTGAQSGTTIITFPANTRYIRFMFVDPSVSSVVDGITGRIARFVLANDGANTELVYCLTKTEDLNNVL